MTDKKKKGSGPSYSEASAELETILQEIESGEIDLDLLSDKVERAAALLALCRQKLAATETRVHRVVAEMAAEHGTVNGDAEATTDEARDEGER
jgi:exodeoxyribonuclease VII small subunit